MTNKSKTVQDKKYYAIRVSYKCYSRTLPYRLEVSTITNIVAHIVSDVLDAHMQQHGYSHEVVEVPDGPENFKS